MKVLWWKSLVMAVAVKA